MRVQYVSKNLSRNQKKNFLKTETATAPTLSDIPSDRCFTLLMIDPDAGKQTPTSPRPGNSDRYYLHWLVVNVSMGDITSGTTLVPYQGPTPPPNTGKHEYIFQLYEQPCGLTNGLVVKNRSNWSLQQFLQGKNLQLVESVSMKVGQ